MTEKEKQTLSDHFERVLESLLARVSVSAASGGQAVKMAVACSGGPDSMVLLDLAAAWAEKNAACLFAFHVHHGLNEKADAWLLHCEDACKKRGVAFDSRRVVPDIAGGTGLEAAARGARYAALAEMCRVHGVGLLLTAHHEDDQAETVLLQLMRGAGVAGLCGMGILGDIPDAGGDDAPRLVRPLLDVPKSALEAWAQERGLVFVVDDSNEDVRFARNAVRQKLAPLLAEYFPGFEKRIARSAGHLQSAQRLLDAMAQADLAGCSDGDALDISRMTHLGQDRFDNLLRFWMSSRGMKMPSTAWLAEAQRQLTGARDDAQVQLAHDGMLFKIGRAHV